MVFCRVVKSGLQRSSNLVGPHQVNDQVNDILHCYSSDIIIIIIISSPTSSDNSTYKQAMVAGQ